MKKRYPKAKCYNSWKPTFKRFWNNKIWEFEIRGYTISLDFRKNFKSELIDKSYHRRK
jgi:hypothetical protein